MGAICPKISIAYLSGTDKDSLTDAWKCRKECIVYCGKVVSLHNFLNILNTLEGKRFDSLPEARSVLSRFEA